MQHKAILIFLCCFGILLFACRAIAEGIPPTPNEQTPQEKQPQQHLLDTVTDKVNYASFNTDTFESIIVPQEKAADFIYALNGETIEQGWTPSQKDILLLEERIQAYLETELIDARLMPLSNYQRQYAGANVKEHHLLYGNFFCQSFDVDWRKIPIVVLDGGNCFFHVIYDLKTEDFVLFNINGEG